MKPVQTAAAAMAAALALSPLALSPLALSPLALASGAAAAAAPKVHTVAIGDMAFGRVPAGVRAGDVVVWVNKDIFRHTATARDKSFDVDLAPGKSARTVVKKPGAVSFYCRYHPGMTGRLIVGR